MLRGMPSRHLITLWKLQFRQVRFWIAKQQETFTCLAAKKCSRRALQALQPVMKISSLTRAFRYGTPCAWPSPKLEGWQGLRVHPRHMNSRFVVTQPLSFRFCQTKYGENTGHLPDTIRILFVLFFNGICWIPDNIFASCFVVSRHMLRKNLHSKRRYRCIIRWTQGRIYIDTQMDGWMAGWMAG